MPAWEFARDWERRVLDAEMPAAQAKVLLVSALNKETISRLDAFIAVKGGDEMAKLDSIQDRLRRVPYESMLRYLKQGNLLDLPLTGASGGKGRPGGGTFRAAGINAVVVNRGADGAFRRWRSRRGRRNGNG